MSTNFYFLFLITCFVNYFQKGRTSTLIGTNLELCGHENTIEFNRLDETSSMIVTLLSPIDEQINNCKLKIKAPKTYLINMHFIETDLFERINNSEILEDEEQETQSCMMRIYLPDNPRIPVWEDDLCTLKPIKYIDLLTSDFEIRWTPPKPQENFINKGRKFVLTAIGQGQTCKQPGHHTCMKIGREPIFCISDDLLCDGINNCPKSSTTNDEDDELCNLTLYSPTSFKQLAEELFKRFQTPTDIVNNSRLSKNDTTNPTTPNRAFLNWKEWQQLKKIELTTTLRPTVKEEKNKLTDSVSQILSKYGPWGYLMLGMLICGTVLMFCGLWECCIRKPKSQIIDLTSSSPTIPQPTTVLIINNQQQDEIVNNTLPPNYEDLDQPPSYTTLFPNFKLQSIHDADDNTRNVIIDIDNNSTECSCNNNSSTSRERQNSNVDET